VSFATLQWNSRFSVLSYTRKLRTGLSASEKEICNFEVETPPHHAICPPMRHFKPMEAVSFAGLVQQKNGTVFRFRVIY